MPGGLRRVANAIGQAQACERACNDQKRKTMMQVLPVVACVNVSAGGLLRRPPPINRNHLPRNITRPFRSQKEHCRR